MFILVDEGGDLGASEGLSRYFIISFMIINDLDRFRRIPRKVRTRCKQDAKTVELKHRSSSERTISEIIQRICAGTVEIDWVAIKKEKNSKQIKWFRCYEEVAKIGFQMICNDRDIGGTVVIVDSFTKNRAQFDSFEKMVRSTWSTSPFKGNERPPIVSFRDSMSEPALQVNDFVTGTIFRWLERGNIHNYEIIRKMVIFGILINEKDLLAYNIANEPVHLPGRVE
jgi:hypothetical protein